MKKENELGEAPIRSLFFKYYFPALISILSSTVHQVINGAILGQQVGKEGLAVVGLYGPVVILFIALALPLMIGSGIFISKNIGAQRYDLAQNIFQLATTLALAFGGIVVLSTPFLITPMAHFLAGAENSILVKNLSDYMFWQLMGMPLFFINMFWSGFIRNDNAPNISKNASLIAVSLNIMLDLVLILGYDMGVKGASIATALSSLVSVLYLFIHITKGQNHFGFQGFRFTVKLKEWKELLHLGLPTFASELSFSCGLLLISHRTVPYGPMAVSAFGMINYVSFILIRFFTAAMIASLPIISYNIGAKLPLRVIAIFKFSMVFTLILGGVISILGFVLPHWFIELLSSDTTTTFRQMASNGMGLYFLLFLAAGPNYILSAYLQSIGKSTMATLINVLKGFVLIALLLNFLPNYLHMGLDGVWLSRSLAEILTLLLIGTYTLFKKEMYYTSSVISPDK